MNSSYESSEQSPKTPKGRKLVQGRLLFAAVDNKNKPTQVACKNGENELEKEKLELSISSESDDKDFEEDNSKLISNCDQSVMSTSINLNSSIEKETPIKTEQAKKKREEKLKEKEVREKKKAEERALKEQQKKDKEEEKKKREEQKELDKKRKEEEKKRKEEEKEADRKRKEEEKKRKEEEKKRKEEEKENEKKRKEEEERRKKERLSQVFSNFFTQKKTTPAKVEIKGEALTLAFPPFQVKDNMKLAPLVRTQFDLQRRGELDNALKQEFELPSLSISDLNFKPGRKTGPTWPLTRETERDNEVEVVEEEEGEEEFNSRQNVIRLIPANCKRVRAKLLQFCENRRPAYWGTWGKKSGAVAPRRPFGRDAFFDYEVDSDDEWEEVEPGESLTDCEDEDKEPADDYDVDNDFLVPHGYLSEEEGENDEDEKPLSPSAAKEQLKIKEEQFERELKEKKHHIKPSLIGCYWSESLEEEPHILKVLKKYAGVIVSEHNIVSLALHDLGNDDAPNVEDVRSDNKVSRKPINDDDIPVLLKILHGSTYSKVTIVKEFLTYLKQMKNDDTKNAPSKAKILSKIAEIASWRKCSEPGPMNGRVCWLVHAEILQRYYLQDLSVVNGWEFSTDIKKRGRTKTDDSKLEEETPPSKTPRMSLIRKFVDAVVPIQSTSQDVENEVKNAETKITEQSASCSTLIPKAKKRIALISVSTSASKKIKSDVKSTPLNNFLKRVTTKANSESKPLKTEGVTDMDGVECLD